MARPFTSLEDRKNERRAQARRRTLLAARLASGDPVVILPCGVRNLSDHGAEIELESPALLQPPFSLLMLRDGVVHEARLAWAWGRSAGLQFTASHPSDLPPPPSAKVLRSLWTTLRA